MKEEVSMKHLTVEQTAEELGLTVKAVRQRIARGHLPFRKLGKRLLIPVSELEIFLATLPGRTAKEAVAAVEEMQ